jgi:hypothetical protein
MNGGIHWSSPHSIRDTGTSTPGHVSQTDAAVSASAAPGIDPLAEAHAFQRLSGDSRIPVARLRTPAREHDDQSISRCSTITSGKT